jgi:inner membrane protein
MENLVHTLAGLSLAKAGLDRATPLATAALVISSNIPDVDVIARLGGTASYLQNHRGLTHSLVGLFALALILTLALAFFDRRFRLRRDRFLRPAKPARLFAISYLGGLGHVFMDYTNSYGARPLLPFDDRWFYGDIAFVVDPWLWLMLGAAVVWLGVKTPARVMMLIVVGGLASLLMAMVARQPSEQFPIAIPTALRVVWFVGLAVVLLGALLNWGRAGEKLARYSLLAAAIYYVGMWAAHQEASDRAKTLAPEGATVVAVWPTPANPLVWQAVATGDGVIYSRHLDILGSQGEWREQALLDAKFVEPLRASFEARTFLWFSRLAAAHVEEKEDGYAIVLRDVRFNLQMRASLDHEMNIRSAAVRWE